MKQQTADERRRAPRRRKLFALRLDEWLLTRLRHVALDFKRQSNRVLEDAIRRWLAEQATTVSSEPGRPPGLGGNARLPTLEEVERRHISRVLTETGGNASEASRILDINRRTLVRKLERYGFDPSKFKKRKG
jgi:DNA-binding NtrC family response regulator